MSVYTIKTSQTLPISLQEAWDFISSPHNLEKITPPGFGFKIINGVLPEHKMYAGQMIVYKLSPIPGIRLKWVTEITQVSPLAYFIDEQRHGPYALWHHEHFLKEVEGGVQMDDIIHYKIPFGLLGVLANHLFVRKKLASIFAYRKQQLEALFGKL